MKRIAGAVFLALLVTLPSAQLADFEARRAAARAELVQRLEAYVEWCQSKELFQERSKAYELLLGFEPAHPQALKILGYTHEKDGSWKAPEKPKAYRDFDKKALAEAPARYQAACAGYVVSMRTLLDTGALAPQQVELAAAEVLRFDADNAHVHELLGEVRGEKGWVIPASLRAKQRREELRGIVREALEGPEAVPVPLNEREQGFHLKMQAVASARLRVVGTVPHEELLLVAKAGTAVERMLKAVFQSKYAQPIGCAVFLLNDQTESQTFIENHPAISAAQRVYYQKLEGGGIQGTNDSYFWAGDAQRRTDGIVRLLLGYWLSGAFQVSVDHGWVYEGFGLVLTRSLVRTRMTWLAEPSQVLAPEQELALRQRLMASDANWLDEAHQMLVKKQQPPLADLFRKGASQLTTQDVVYAYALATYLLEARPELCSELLERIGRGAPGSAVFQEALGMDLASFETHLCRWLSERN